MFPRINPNYKPTADNWSDRASHPSSTSTKQNVKLPTFDSEIYSGKKKSGQTRVYSGAGRRSGFTDVPKLYDLCILVLQENVDSIDECGGLSYHILEPILTRAKPNILMNIEDHNEYLLEDTVQLWERHCKKEFPKEERKIEECETWREMYERCSQEKADKFERLTSKAKESYKKLKTDSRSTKLWDKRGGAKPPRDIKIKQERNGTAFNAPSNSLSKRGRPSLMDPTRASSSAASENSRSSTENAASAPKKPKTAPLMAKTLKLARGLSRGGGFRR